MNGVLIREDRNDDMEYVAIIPSHETDFKMSLGSANLINALDEIEKKKMKPTEKKVSSLRTVSFSANPFWKTNDYWQGNDCWSLQHPFVWPGLGDHERVSRILFAAGHLVRSQKAVHGEKLLSRFRIFNQHTCETICEMQWTNKDLKMIEITNISVQLLKKEGLLGIELHTSKENVDMKATGIVYACSIEIEKTRPKHHHKSPKIFRMTDNIVTKF